MKYLLGILDTVEEDVLVDWDKYGLSTPTQLQSASHEQKNRNLKSYQEFSGVDFKNQTLTQKAKWGGLDKIHFVDNIVDIILSQITKY